MCVEPGLSVDKVFAEYFLAWEKHDINMLEKIFTSDCQYEIKGLRTYDTLSEVKKYWKYNADRQKKVSITWQPVESNPGFRSAIFFARFFDLEEKQHQIISGIINLHVRPSDGRIYKLSEVYHKEVIKPRHWIYRVWSWLVGRIEIIKIGFLRRWNRAIYKFVTASIAVSFIIIVAYVYVSYFSVPSVVAVVFSDEYRSKLSSQDILNMSLPTVTRSAINNGTDNLIGILGGISRPLVAVILALFYLRRFFIEKDVKEIKLSESNTDLDVMAHYLGGASEVRIFSGSFDFIKDNLALLDVFKNLAESRDLQLISFRSYEEIIDRNRNNHDVIQILSSVMQSGKFRVESGINLNMSIYKSRGVTTVLYKHAVAGQDENSDYILRVESRRFTSGFVEITKKLSDKIYEFASRPQPSQRKNLQPKAIFVCGKIHAGKTSFCKYLKACGAEIVSASEVIRKEMSEYASRQEMQDGGMKLLQTKGPRWFGERLDAMSSSELVVFDGIRSLEAINCLKDKYVNSIIVYIDTQDSLREERYKQSNPDGPDFVIIDCHPIEIQNEAIKSSADFCLSHVGGECEARHAMSLVEHYAQKRY